MKQFLWKAIACCGSALFSLTTNAQVNSGSDGHDGAFNPTANVTIDTNDHPDGIYQYTSVNVPAGVTVKFIPNAANTPVVWLVQTTCQISGQINISGKQGATGIRGEAGLGGYRGGSPGSTTLLPGNGLGPGGAVATNTSWMAGNASFATLGGVYPAFTSYGTDTPAQDPPGATYGSIYLLPLMGGSGGAGHRNGMGGCGGGGALMIAANQSVTVNGSIRAEGGSGDDTHRDIGGGSGGGIRGAVPRRRWVRLRPRPRSGRALVQR